MTASKEAFAEESELEFKSLFWSVGGKSSTSTGESSKQQNNYMSTSIVVQGGSQRIAAIISDMYSPTFKTEFTTWLESIPAYPKAFKFLMGSVTDLLDFRTNDLFPDETIQYHCELRRDELKEDEKTKKKYYIRYDKKVYCEFESREDLENKLKLKRMSLKRAIEVYMEEGAMSISDVSLPAGEPGCESEESETGILVPTWSEMTTAQNPSTFRVTFDLLEGLNGATNGGIDIQKSMSRLVRYRKRKWVTANEQGQFHWYGGFSNGASATLTHKKISIFGLVLQYDEADGSLVLDNADYEESKKYFPDLSDLLVNKRLAQVEWTEQGLLSRNAKKKKKSDGRSSTTTSTPPPLPCNVQWSNGFGFDPSDSNGKCLHFTASSKGNLYVVFSAVPSNKETWYYVEISPYRIGIYKLSQENPRKVSTVKKNAVALGDSVLFQSYFVCITESATSKGTLIEYGKSMGTISTADVYLSMSDYHDPLHVRFYSFGNGKEPAQVVDSHVVSRRSTETKCKGDTEADGDNCVQVCHEACDPIAGCSSVSQGEPKPTECNECRFAKSEDGSECLLACPTDMKPDKKKQCRSSYDLKFKNNDGDSTSHQSEIDGFPKLPELSFCIWVNFEGVPITRTKIFEYVNSGTRSEIVFTFEPVVYESTERIIMAGLQTFFRSPEGNQRGLFVQFPKDTKWHHFCLTRNSITGYTSSFRDGRKRGSFVIFPGLTPLEGIVRIGKFKSEYFEGKISSFNIWDRVLTDEEIPKMAQSCDDSAGSLIDWYDIKGKLAVEKYEFFEPSTCKVTIASEGAVEARNSLAKKKIKKKVRKYRF